jgi:UDP-GlcNAc:undecaprenyl-phosphate GlcNAc-1-phosphate transferase
VYATQVRDQEERILIYGAGDAGEMALRWILMNPGLGLKPVGFLDDDTFKTGRQIHGVEVLGDLQQLGDLISEKDIDGVIISSDVQLADSMFRRLVSIVHSQGRWVRRLHFEFELVE